MPAHRVLVELAGQNRAMTLKELFEATDLIPETLHPALDDLCFGTARYVKRSYDNLPDSYLTNWDSPLFTITWEGQEMLRRLDEPPKVDTVVFPRTRAGKRRWYLPWT
jgi:hypothetical protein